MSPDICHDNTWTCTVDMYAVLFILLYIGYLLHGYVHVFSYMHTVHTAMNWDHLNLNVKCQPFWDPWFPQDSGATEFLLEWHHQPQLAPQRRKCKMQFRQEKRSTARKNKLFRMPNWTLGWDFGIHVATNYLMLDKANKMLICSRPMELTDGAGNHALWRQSTAGAGTASELWWECFFPFLFSFSVNRGT